MSARSIKILPYGRLGNNITQMKHAIMVALQYGIESIVFPKYTKTPLVIEKQMMKQSKVITDQQLADCTASAVILFDIRRLKKVLPCFDFQDIDDSVIIPLVRDFFISALQISQTVTEFDAGRLVIHIRSGDIFQRPHAAYVQPPLSFYKTIIDAKQWHEIVLVAEDRLNPTIDVLLQEYKHIQFRGQTFKDAVTLIINASTVVGGTGFFAREIISLSRGEKHFICFLKNKITRRVYQDGQCTEHSSPVNVEGYIQRWKNSAVQKRMMIDFKLEQHCDFSAFKRLLTCGGTD